MEFRLLRKSPNISDPYKIKYRESYGLVRDKYKTYKITYDPTPFSYSGGRFRRAEGIPVIDVSRRSNPGLAITWDDIIGNNGKVKTTKEKKQTSNSKVQTSKEYSFGSYLKNLFRFW